MKIHYLQHVPFEGLGSMEPWLQARGHLVSGTRLYAGQTCPDVAEFDGLIVMGGPMGIYDEAQYPWLVHEKDFLREAIACNKPILGICLGAQLLADALGAKVTRNARREIGWFPIEADGALNNTVLAGVFPKTLEAFHWHGDTFALPEGALPVASSEACSNQGFIFDDRIFAFQFHLETTPAAARALVENCRDELAGSRYVQSEVEILGDEGRFAAINRVMDSVLDVWEHRFG
jgi:GMP synthase-like glutamine amidotransferase